MAKGIWLWLLVAWMVVLAAGAAEAPPVPPVAPVPELTAEAVQARRKLAEDSKELDEALKKSVLALYDQALAQIGSAGDSSGKAQAFEQAAKAAPALLAALQKELAAPAPEAKADAPADATVAQLEQRVAQAEADLAAARKTLEERSAELDARTARRKDIPKLLTDVRKAAEKVGEQLAAAPDPAEPQAAAAARTLLLRATQRALEAQEAMLQKELLRNEAEAQVAPLRRDQAARHVSVAEKSVQAWRDVVNEGRRREAELAAKQARQARREAANAHPSVATLTEENEKLAELRTGPTGLTARIEKAVARLDAATKELARLREERKGVEDKVDKVGLTQPIALILRRKRAELSDIGDLRRGVRTRQGDMAAVEFDLILRQEARQGLAEIEPRVESLLADIGDLPDEEQREDIRAALQAALEAQRGYLDALITDTKRLLSALADLDVAERELIGDTEAFAGFINEHILWTQSTAPIGVHAFVRAWDAACWLLSPREWRDVLRTAFDDVRRNPHVPGLGLLLVVLLWQGRRRLRRRLRALEDADVAAEGQGYAHIVQEVAVSAAVALPWPLMLALVGWRLGAPVAAGELAKALGAGLVAAACVFFVFALVRLLIEPDGIVQTHSRWSREALDIMQRNLRWLVPIIVGAHFLQAALDAQTNDAWRESLGRFAFLIATVAWTVLLARVFRPHGFVMTEYGAHHTASKAYRLRFLWFGALMAFQVAMAVVAVLGYYYTARELAWSLRITVWFLLAVALVHTGLVGWMLVVWRKLIVRDRSKAAPAAPPSMSPNGETPRPESPSQLYAPGLQSRRLMRWVTLFVVLFGLWLIWSDVFPALGILKRVTVWTTTQPVSEVVTGAGEGEVTRVVERRVPVTLAHVALMVLFIVMTVIASRNVPGLLQLTVLHRLPLDQGARFAITTMVRYLITFIGALVVLSTIGIGWSKVQWLIAALGVGLGFGLQEIVANFISGLIILFEQPMRVGDTVTVGDTTGTVTEIRIRATTITDWDRKELLVPNKEFITGRLVNWTRSDEMIRLTFRVGIAYGSDTEKAERTLLDVARKSPLLIGEPKPSVVFRGFGDSSLQFELRAYIPDMRHYWQAWHYVHMAIDKAFREASIVIAFPQQDLHVRSVAAALPGLSLGGKSPDELPPPAKPA